MSSILSPIKVVTYNIHKGMSPLNRYVRLYSIATALQQLDIDTIFLQEVQGDNRHRTKKFLNFPSLAQHNFLAEALALNATYGKNALYADKHHGNAILSRFPLGINHNLNISVNNHEQRGILHCSFKPYIWPVKVVSLCAHLNLLHHDRVKQYHALIDYINNKIDPDLPLILAGDFNDWHNKASAVLRQELGLTEAHIHKFGAPAKTFPAKMPVLTLDRIYVRHLLPLQTEVLNGIVWRDLSDHLPLCTTLVLNLKK